MQRLWIFQFKTEATDAQAAQLTLQLSSALTQWAAHKVPVQSQFRLRHRYFIIIEALSEVSGCSIDWLRRTVESACGEAGVALADPTQLAYHAGEKIALVTLQEVQAALKSGRLSPETIIFDNTVMHEGNMAGWEKPLGESWVARRLALQSA